MTDQTDGSITDTTAPSRGTGRGYVGVDLIGTALFTVVVAVAVPLRDRRGAQVVVAIVSTALFALGTLLALWAYAAALERSRSAEIGVADLYLLTGATAPRRVRVVMTLALVVQVLVALVGAALGLRGLEGDDLNALAFGVLVPMLGIGTNGAWAARYGSFGPRVQAATPTGGRRRR